MYSEDIIGVEWTEQDFQRQDNSMRVSRNKIDRALIRDGKANG